MARPPKTNNITVSALLEQIPQNRRWLYKDVSSVIRNEMSRKHGIILSQFSVDKVVLGMHLPEEDIIATIKRLRSLIRDNDNQAILLLEKARIGEIDHRIFSSERKFRG